VSETKELLRRGVGGFEPMPDAFERVLGRRDRKRRNQRVAAGVLGIAVFALAAIGILRAFSSGTVPADKTPLSPFVGTWELFAHNSLHTLEFRVAGDGTLALELSDEAATVCDGLPATETGVGTLSSSTEMTVASQVITCQDGTVLKDVPPATYTYDPGTDALTDSFGAVWERAGSEDPSPEPTLSGGMWPQTSLEEVRQAQELADAGDLAYTWQVDPRLTSQEWWGYLRQPGAEIVERFLREELGWDEFLFNPYAENGAADGVIRGVVYLRCAPGGTNPLYPIAPDGHQEAPGAERCAPTIDEFRYETVSLDLSQLDRWGPDGIWVVSAWHTGPQFRQAPPPSDAAVAEVLDGFLAARVTGEGAQGYVSTAEEDIPLLYEATAGAPYERAEFDRVGSPVWPYGFTEFKVRLFADGGETVVEQRFMIDPDVSGRFTLNYYAPPDGIAPTTVNGQPLAVPYSLVDGEVTFAATNPPWDFAEYEVSGPTVTTLNPVPYVSGGMRIVVDPIPIGTGCRADAEPADAEALAQRILSDPDIEATQPVPVRISGIDAIQMDVAPAPGGSICDESNEAGLFTTHASASVRHYTDISLWDQYQYRIYLLDVPAASTRILAVVMYGDDRSFEDLVDAAAPVLDSFEFHARTGEGG
jgi:hypothetical protein